MPFLKEQFGNPSSIYHLGRGAREAVENSRETVADFLGCRHSEIVFTGSGTEADNLAVKGVAWSCANKGKHVITSSVEHHAVLHACRSLEKQGFEVTHLPVDRYGRVDPERLRSALRNDTILISITHGNNEVGTVQPVEKIGVIAREHGIFFHTDAVQSFGQIPTCVTELRCDLLSLSAHKIYGPKGVGALYVRRGCRLAPLLDGGGQEKNRRSGTENVAGIVGLGKAVGLVRRQRETGQIDRIRGLRDRLAAGLERSIPEVRLNGHPSDRLPNNLNYSVRYLEGEGMLLELDLKDICASSGSACTSGSLEPSHVLSAMGVTHEWAHGTIRFTLGKDNTAGEIDTVLEVFPPIVERLRSLRTRESASPKRSERNSGALVEN